MANLKDLIVNGSARVLGTLYANDIRNTDRVTEFIVGTQTATTGSWTGITKDDALYDGKNINYFLPQAGSGNASLNLTLSNGTTTGAKPVYRWGTSYVTTHYPINSCINMTYNATKGAWFVDADYDSNNYERLLHSNDVYALEALVDGGLACGTKDGYKKIASGISFDISYPLLRTGNVSASANFTGFLIFPSVNLQTTKASWTGTQKSMVYLVGTLSGTTFTIDSSVFTTTVPTTQDNKVYMPIGILYNTYQVYFNPSKDLYAYRDGSFQRVGAKYVQGSATQPIYFDSNGQPQNTTYTLSKSVPSDAVFTDTTYSAGTGITLSGTEISVTDYSKILKNGVTSSNSLSLLGSNVSSGAISILGGEAYNNATAIGSMSEAKSSYSIALGAGAKVSNTASYAIQLGYGTNNSENSLYVGLSSNNNYQLLNALGIIPSARLPKASTSALGAVKPDGTTITIDSNGVISSTGGGSSYAPTVTVSGSSWCRVYPADSTGYRWCEQGGLFTTKNTAAYETVNLLQTYKDVDYTAICSLSTTASAGYGSAATPSYFTVVGKTVSNFQLLGSPSQSLREKAWFTAGYLPNS